MASNISVVPSKPLSFISNDKVSHLFTELEPLSRRFDTLTPSNGTGGVNSDSFLTNNSQPYMNLRVLKTDRFTIQQTIDTTPFKSDAFSLTATEQPLPILVSPFNITADNFCLSKAIDQISIKWGNGSELKEYSETRNPFLMEVKSSFLDIDECKKHGLSPLFFDGVGNLGAGYASGTPFRRTAWADARQPKNLSYIDKYEIATELPSTKVIQNSTSIDPNAKRRVTLIGTPVFKKGDGTALTAAQNIGLGIDGWYATETAAGPPPTQVPYLGITKVEYTIEISEYLLGSFLTTPYSRNKTERVIKVTPNIAVNFEFQYNTQYIANGLFKSIDNTELSTTSLTVNRIPSESKISLESFDVINPPEKDFNLQFVSWEPERLEVAQTGPLGPGATANITVLNKSSTRVPQYLLIGADPNLHNGLQNPALTTAGLKNGTCSTFMSADITDCTIKLNQTTLTDNIPIGELKKMTLDLINSDDPDVRDIVSGIKRRMRFSLEGNTYQFNGFPFLLIDLQKLNMRSSNVQQIMANVDYGVYQGLDINFTIKTQAFNGSSAASLIYYPQVYRFWPMAYIQEAGKRIEKVQVYMSAADAAGALMQNWRNDTAVDLNMITGAGFFDDAKAWIKENSESVLKSLVKGVRLGEEMLRDSEHRGIHTGLKAISEGARVFGYGQQGGAPHHSRKSRAHAMLR